MMTLSPVESSTLFDPIVGRLPHGSPRVSSFVAAPSSSSSPQAHTMRVARGHVGSRFSSRCRAVERPRTMTRHMALVSLIAVGAVILQLPNIVGPVLATNQNGNEAPWPVTSTTSASVTASAVSGTDNHDRSSSSTNNIRQRAFSTSRATEASAEWFQRMQKLDQQQAAKQEEQERQRLERQQRMKDRREAAAAYWEIKGQSPSEDTATSHGDTRDVLNGMPTESSHNGRANRVFGKVKPPPLHTMEAVDLDQLFASDTASNSTNRFGIGKEKLRRQLSWWNSNSGGEHTSSVESLADPSQGYDKWAQAYRMLGGYIDCDHIKSSNNRNGGSKDNNKNKNYNSDVQPCSRWMMWAAYVNPNYQGNGYDEYFADEPYSQLDCHSPTTEWQLLGVYRQEFYQFIEQISKHLWSINDYEYTTAVAGLSYMTNSDCFQVGYASDGTTAVYAGVAPQPYGEFQMGLYTDPYCLQPNNSLGKTYDDYTSSSNNKDSDYSQEYKLSELNSVYDDFRYCTSCVDYPTYQDGYFIGNDGTDDGDLINQCWKFYSHNSYICEADCIAKGNAQGTILSVSYGEASFGKPLSSYYTQRDTSDSSHHRTSFKASMDADSKLTRLAANAFLTISFLVFAATFLAFAVARRSRYRESRSSKSRRLLDDDGHIGDADGRSRKSSRSAKSRAAEGDGLFRTSNAAPSSSSRTKSKERSKSRSGTVATPDSKSKRSRSKSYEPPSGRSRSVSRGVDA